MFINKELIAMSNIKGRILGAVTVMSESDASTLWELIIENFSDWTKIEEITPDELDVAMIQDISNNPECQQFVSSNDVMKMLGLK